MSKMKGAKIVLVFGFILTICLAEVVDSIEDKSSESTSTEPPENSEKSNSVGNESENEVKKQGKGKRVKSTFHPVPLPSEFKVYDVLEKDGFISLEELIHVTEAKENVELAFNASDKDGDGLLSEEEFKAAPWMLQGDSPVDDEEVKELEEKFQNQPSTPPPGGADTKTVEPVKIKPS